MKLKIRLYTLALKYWAQGDDWKMAKKYAGIIIHGFKKNPTNR